MRTTSPPAHGRPLARALAAGWLTLGGLTLAASSAHAVATPHPHPHPHPQAHAKSHPQRRDSNGNLSNTVTSPSPGANCVTGTEPDCSTLTVRAVPMISDPAAALAAAIPITVGAIVLSRRRTTRHSQS